MSSSEKFCLRWNDFESNISGAFRELRQDKDFFDVTLACDDEQLQAHKVIISACSPFFRAILKRNKHEHPLVYLKGMKYTDLVSVMDFMYHGEVNVAQEELNSFLAVAEDLKVKGLTQDHPDSAGKQQRKPENNLQTNPSTVTSIKPLTTTYPYQQPQQGVQEDDDVQEVIPVKSEPVQQISQAQTFSPVREREHGYSSHQDTRVVVDPMVEYNGEEYGDYQEYSTGDVSYDTTSVGPAYPKNTDLDELIAQSMNAVVDEYGNRVWKCEVCSRTNKDKTNTSKHVETHFQGFQHHCSLCGKPSKSREAMRKHMANYHKSL